MKDISPSVFKIMELPRIGGKTAFKLVTGLKLKNSKNPISDLYKKAKAGEVAVLEGFSDESQTDIVRSVEEMKRMVKDMSIFGKFNSTESHPRPFPIRNSAGIRVSLP